MYRKNKDKLASFAIQLTGVCLCLSFFSELSLAVTNGEIKNYGFVKNLFDLKPSLTLPVNDHIESVTTTASILRARAKKAESDTRIEPLQVKVPASSKNLAYFVKKNAKAQKASALYQYLTQKLSQTNSPKQDDGTQKVTIDLAGYDLFNIDALTQIFERPHHNVEINTAKLNENKTLKNALVSQISDYLGSAQKSELMSKINKNKNLSFDKDLLPDFARKMVKSFLAFKGPNCFHAALAFHGESITKSQYVNVKREDGYHSAMINYDELWRAIKAYFYEVNATATPLKYGDMIVFFELPPENETADGINYRWIRHATTYLADKYTFSKGSKSPDTPYTVKTLDEEWKAWQGYTKNLGVKVFRPSMKNARKVPPVDLVDWVY